MTKFEYAKAIAAIVDGEVKEVDKANGIVKTGILKRVEGNIAPTIYIDDMYDDGISIEEAVAHVNKAFESNDVQGFMTNNKNESLDWVNDFDKVKSKLRARLYNKKTKAEVYRSAEAFGFDDLIIVPYIVDVLPMTDGLASIKVTRDLFNSWNVSEDTLFRTALYNCRQDVVKQTMAEMLSSLMGSFMPDLGIPMYVITNTSKSYGAIGIISEIDNFTREFPNGFSVIPSSVHEVIVVEAGMEGLADMIKDVNRTEVDEVDQLSDHEYNF